MRYSAVIEYDGADYYGFQRQSDGPTIQGELESALEKISGTKVSVVGAGRTDSGVHALGQVIAFDLLWQHRLNDLQRALNANLSSNIVILELSEVDTGFHPRFDARWRTYEYHIFSAPVRSPLRHDRCWHVSQPLDMSLMDAAAASLVGTHDFATFGQPPKGTKTFRTVRRALWRQRAELIVFTIEANAFLYRMVRGLVGTMKLVGDGAWTLDKFAAAFSACDRSRAGKTAPPYALYLKSVSYE